MTQDELKLVLDALKWCHGGEPCGTAEAIAVIEKALANVATNDTSKEYVDEMQKQRHEQETVACIEYIPCCTNKTCPKCKATTPPQRTWVALTDEERKNIMIECESTGDWAWELKAAQAIEAKLKQKNGYAEEENT